MEQISLIFISQLGECWLRPRLPSLYVFFLTSLFSCHVLCIVLCTLYIPRPALWFNMHDKFYSCVHTHYPWDWTPAFSSTQRWRGNAMLWLGSKPVRRSLNLGLESDPHVFVTSLLDVLPGDVDVFQLSTHTHFVLFVSYSTVLFFTLAPAHRWWRSIVV